ncbi:MAG: cytochrome c peroxidase [Pseudohongiella sp.]|nr:cytochrome c peroxidase [Pseudohongiella sp.]
MAARIRVALATGMIVFVCYLGWQQIPAPLPAQWSTAELALLHNLSLDSLPPLPADPGNAVADHPLARQMGQLLFFDTRLSANNEVSCATCHQPDKMFTDGRALAVGLSQADRNSMGLVGVAYSPWLFWDGRKDSLWSQALEPLENPLEHGSNRVQLARLVLTDPVYSEYYDALFGIDTGFLTSITDKNHIPAASPSGDAQLKANWDGLSPQDQHAVNIVFSNIGKTLAAWLRQLTHTPSVFDKYVSRLATGPSLVQENTLSKEQLAGLRLFIGKAQCVNCHNGPLFTNNSFHNTAVLSAPGIQPAAGRSQGLRLAQSDIFNCLGPYSDAKPSQCQELRFARGGDEMIGAQRTASLRNLAATAPYMHAGQITTLEDVINHYNRAQIAVIGHNEAKPLALRAVEKRQLRAFLDSLNGGVTTEADSM